MKADLQGNILAGYPLKRALYAFLRVEDAAAARRWIGERPVTTADRWENPPSETFNIAFTFDGLRALGVPERLLETFPPEFREGMASRADKLGDTGASAPGLWEAGLRPGEPHALVTIYARDLEEPRRRLLADVRDSGGGLALVHEQEAAVLEQEGDAPGIVREHFGFADGLSQPSIDDPGAGPYDQDGKGTPGPNGRWKGLAAGEFVLGYRDEEGMRAQSPGEPLRQSGTYVVVRKLEQDVALFTRYLRRAADDDPDREELLAAKIVGRWRNGTPLVLSPDRPLDELSGPGRKELTSLHDFRYAGDENGFKCPLGAHIRRANPRDALSLRIAGHSRKAPGDLTRRHRIIRRGMPYGERAEDPAIDDGQRRGLMFVCYQASIERQFEVIQGSWMSDGDAFGLGSDRDMLIGGEVMGKMTIQGERPTVLSAQPQFVTLRGGGYFFAPGVGALKELAAGIQ